MVFHADVAIGRGGYLGVDVFFVISGFLITSILLRELRSDGAISFADFFERRARRIMPAMLAVIGGTALACQLLRPEALPALGNDAIASLLMLANWHFVLNGISYFEKFEGYRMLEHFWSLALEEQFYMAWPLVVLAVAARWGRAGLGRFAAGLAFGSAVWMAWLAYVLGFPESMDINRVYFGTDTHAVGLLVGAALACSFARVKAYLRLRYEARRELIARLLAFCSLTGLLILLTQVAENHPLLYPLGFVVTSLCTAGLIFAFTISPSCGKVFDLQPLKWIGERSYGIYLWHWPVFALTRPGLDIDLSQDQTFLLRCLITLALAAISYHLIEVPMLSSRTPLINGNRQRLALFALSTAIVSGLSVFIIQTEIIQTEQSDSLNPRALLLSSNAAPANETRRVEMQSMLQRYDLGSWRGGSQDVKAGASEVMENAQSAFAPNLEQPRRDWSAFLASAIANRTELGMKREADNLHATVPPTRESVDKPSVAANDAVVPPSNVPAPPATSSTALSVRPVASTTTAVNPSNYTAITLFGDSVLLGARGLIERSMAEAAVHAEVGWQASDVLNTLQRVRESGELHPIVLIHLGTNGYVTEKQLRTILDMLRDRQRVLVVNTRVPKRWMAANNALIEAVVPTYRNTVLIDWFGISDSRSDYFVADGVHLTASGMRAFVAAVTSNTLIAQAR